MKSFTLQKNMENFLRYGMLIVEPQQDWIRMEDRMYECSCNIKKG